MSRLWWKKRKKKAAEKIGFWQKIKSNEFCQTRLSDTPWDSAISPRKDFWNQSFTEIEPAGCKLLPIVKISNIDSEFWICFF